MPQNLQYIHTQALKLSLDGFRRRQRLRSMPWEREGDVPIIEPYIQ